MSAWKPIETAPLDNCMPHYFLVYTSHDNTMMACGMDGELTYLTFMDGITFDTKCYGKPSHWMPLPKPPAEHHASRPTTGGFLTIDIAKQRIKSANEDQTII